MRNFLLGFSLLFSLTAQAEQHVVKMLHAGADGAMVFEPGYVNIALGDSVVFEATDAGHNAESYFAPEGGQTWKGDFGETVTVTFDKPGVYLYQCLPHAMMGMLGVVQVGKAVNLDAAKEAAAEMDKTLMMNKQRLSAYMEMVQ